MQTMKKPIFTIILFILSLACFGQKFLQLEKMNSAKTRKYSPGTVITFQLQGGQWYTRELGDISFEQNQIVFEYGHAKVVDVTAFRTYDSQKWSRPLGNNLYTFAAAWTGFSLIAAAVDKEDTYSSGDIMVAASSIVTGLAIQKIFRQRTFDLKRNKNGQPRKWRLRVLDLNVKPSRNSPTNKHP